MNIRKLDVLPNTERLVFSENEVATSFISKEVPLPRAWEIALASFIGKISCLISIRINESSRVERSCRYEFLDVSFEFYLSILLPLVSQASSSFYSCWPKSYHPSLASFAQ